MEANDPAGLMTITTGLWASQTLVAAVGLDLFTRLSTAPGSSIPDLTKDLALAERPVEILTTACAALGLLERRGEGMHNSPLAEEFLVRGKPYYFGGYIRMLEHHDYPGWMRVADAIRTNRPTAWDPDRQSSVFDGEDPAMLATFWDGMYSLSAYTARSLGRAIDLSSSTTLLDIGGGGAAYDIELCRMFPGLKATVYDLPFVCDLTRKKIEETDMNDRIGLHPGDFFADTELPGGHDTLLLSMILHDWDEPRNRDLLAKCYTALPSGGRLLISELLVDNAKTGPVEAALMSMTMLVENWGRNYTAAEYTQWLNDTGFVDIETIRFQAPGANGVVIGRKP